MPRKWVKIMKQKGYYVHVNINAKLNNTDLYKIIFKIKVAILMYKNVY